jgi:basic amino acid/polyamine antiporter, APA family
MAKDGLFFSAAAKIHPKFGVPSNSIVLQCIIAIVLTLSGSFEQVLTYMGFALGIFPVLTVIGVFKLRREQKNNLRLPGFPYVQLIYIAAGIMILVLSFLERPAESSVALAVVAAGIPAYLLFRRKRLPEQS